jgi:hypothetical protein
MFAFERRWVVAILSSFAPEETSEVPGRLAPKPGEVDYFAAYHALLTEGAPLAGLGLRLGLWLVALSPLFMLGRLTTFAGLLLAERVALLERLLESNVFPLRESTFLLKTAASLALLKPESVRARSHFDGQPAAPAHRLPVLSDGAARSGGDA